MKMKSPKKLTENCFTDFGYRDNGFDAWLPKTQPKQEGDIAVLKLPRAMTFKEMATHFFGSDDVEVIKKHVLTLPMVEKVIKERESELEMAGWSNFFFVENTDGGVSVGYVDRYGRRWDGNVDELGYDHRWIADSRLLVCNLYTPTLSSSDPVLETRIEKLEAIIKHHNLGL